MACFNSRRYSCFGPYYPCPISFCSCRCCNNVVQNPIVVTTNLAFFALTTTTAVDAGANQTYGMYFGLADPDAHYNELAQLADTIPYEILTSLGARVQRKKKG